MKTQGLQIANIFGLDINNRQQSIAIVDALSGIDDLDKFVAYCRENRDSIKFAGKTEKLDALAYRYKKEQFEAKLPHDKARLFARSVSDKVSKCRHVIEEHHCQFWHIMVDSKHYFTKQEINALDTIGGVAWIVELSRNGDLEDKLYGAFIEASRKQFIETKRIGAGTDSKVSAIISKATKGMTC